MESTSRTHMNPEKMSEDHNSRKKELCEREKNIDLINGTHEVWKEGNLHDTYEELFADAIAEFDEKQTRKDRKIGTVENYIKNVENDKRGKHRTKKVNGKKVYDPDADIGKRSEYELIISAGDSTPQKDENGHVMYDTNGHLIRPNMLPEEVNYNSTKRYCMTFQERNPHLKVSRIDWHADEFFTNRKGVKEWDVFHAHIGFVPWADGYNKGMSVQSAIGRALKQQGFQGYSTWLEREREVHEQFIQEEYQKYCKEHPDYYAKHGDLTIVHRKDYEESLSPAQFRDLQERRSLLDEEEADFNDAIDEYNKGVQTAQAERDQLNADKAEFEEYKHRTKKDIEGQKKHASELQSKAQKALNDANEQAAQIIRNAQEAAQKASEDAVRDAEERINEEVKKRTEEAEKRLNQAKKLYLDAKERYDTETDELIDAENVFSAHDDASVIKHIQKKADEIGMGADVERWISEARRETPEEEKVVEKAHTSISHREGVTALDDVTAEQQKQADEEQFGG